MILYKRFKNEELTELRENADRLAQMFLDKARKPIHGRPTFVCPWCGRGGAGDKHKDGMQIGKGGMYYCYHCKKHGADIVELYQRVYDVPFREAVKKLQEMAGTGECKNKRRFSFENKPKPKVDYMEYIRRCKARIGDTTYHRGLSMATLKRFWVGFDGEWRNPEVVAEQKALGSNWQPPAVPTLIIPTNQYGYFARRTGNVNKYDKQYIGECVPFNVKALEEHNGEAIFVVEGEIDAMSIVDCGMEAIGLGGSRGSGGLLDAEALKHFTGTLYIVGDADCSQDKPYMELCEKLQAKGVACDFVAGVILFGTAKDANEALNADREGFRTRLEMFIK